MDVISGGGVSRTWHTCLPSKQNDFKMIQYALDLPCVWHGFSRFTSFPESRADGKRRHDVRVEAVLMGSRPVYDYFLLLVLLLKCFPPLCQFPPALKVHLKMERPFTEAPAPAPAPTVATPEPAPAPTPSSFSQPIPRSASLSCHTSRAASGKRHKRTPLYQRSVSGRDSALPPSLTGVELTAWFEIDSENYEFKNESGVQAAAQETRSLLILEETAWNPDHGWFCTERPSLTSWTTFVGGGVMIQIIIS